MKKCFIMFAIFVLMLLAEAWSDNSNNEVDESSFALSVSSSEALGSDDEFSK